MPDASNRIFVSIAVSRPGGGLEQLPGAITAAERMSKWAKTQGYITLLLHDEKYPEITIDLLRKKITKTINQVTERTELKRLVIFFAGHGAAKGVEDQYWILTNWETRSTEAIKLSSLQRVLEFYQPKQVSIIADACQEFSPRFIDVDGSALLDKPDEEQHSYELDRFLAADVGKQAFMIKSSGNQKSYCVFTEVLLDALQSDADAVCLEEIEAAKHVTSQTLATHINSALPLEASKYGLKMRPVVRSGFRSDRIYMTIPTRPPKPARPRKSTNSSTAGYGTTADTAFPDMDGSLQQTSAGQNSNNNTPRRSVSKPKLIVPPSDVSALAARVTALQQTREDTRKAFVDEVDSATVRDHFETGCGICVSGVDAVQVQASFGEVSGVDDQPNWFRIRLETVSYYSLGWTDTLITLADGRVVPVCAVNGFVAALHIISAASLSLFHRPLGAGEHEGQEAIDLLAQLHADLLSPQKIVDAAVKLRHGKHRIITLGCIAAQFYDAVRDVDSLRSMAAFYAQRQQPIPLDIILYGGGTLHDFEGRLYVDIPAVAAREARTEQERTQSFTCEPTPAFTHWPVAGRIPWMRQAWGAVATARCDASAADWRRQALLAMEFLAPGLFTVVRPEGHEALARLAGIQLPQAEPSAFAAL